MRWQYQSNASFIRFHFIKKRSTSSLFYFVHLQEHRVAAESLDTLLDPPNTASRSLPSRRTTQLLVMPTLWLAFSFAPGRVNVRVAR